MTEPTEDQTTQRYLTGSFGFVLALAVASLLLYALTQAFQSVECAWIAPLAAIVALPLWRYQVDRILLERRAILASVATPTGKLRKWFWRGSLAASVQVIVAMVLAIVLLGTLSALKPTHWTVLAADVFLMALLIRPVRRVLAGQVTEGYVGLVTRRWPLTALNVALLVGGLVFVDYSIVGWPDTRALPWSQVAETALERARSNVSCPMLGTLLGVTDSINALSRHAASLAIPALPTGPTRVLAWFIFLAWTGIGAFLFTRFLLGIVALIDRVGGIEAGADDRTMRAFIYTILLLAIPTLYATIKYAEWQGMPVELPDSAITRLPVEDLCGAFQFDTAALSDTLEADVRRARISTHALVEERIDAALGHAFGEAEKGVDRYLDWYYSMLGDYSRLAAVVTDDTDEMMTDKLRAYVFEETGVDSILASSSSNLEAETMWLMERAAESTSAFIRSAVHASPCPVPALDLSGLVNLTPDRVRAAVSTAAGGGVAAKVLMAKPAAAMAGKLAAKSTVKAASKVVAKAAVKKGASAATTLLAGGSATAVCSPLGPFAIACGVVAGVVTWVTVDKVVLEVDELVNRDAMRAELIAGLAEQRAEIRSQLVALHSGLVDLYAYEIQEAAEKVFIPARDGT